MQNAEDCESIEDDLENRIDDPIEDSSDEVLPFNYTITSYGADYPVDGLVKRLNNNAIYIPKFQRGYVWKFKDACRFIESLLLGLPVPGIFLEKETDQKLLVIDGNQRLKTLQFFYSGKFIDGKIFALEYVQNDYLDKTYGSLDEDDRRKLDDALIHATVVRQDEPSNDNSSIYHIFERLNTGGKALSSQEIRACIYHGKFNELLNELNENYNWRVIYGKKQQRLKDQELILRFFALYFNFDGYKRTMKNFLNIFMNTNRELNRIPEEEFKKIFSDTVELAQKTLGVKPFRIAGGINAALSEAVLIGIAKRISKGELKKLSDVKTTYNLLLSNKEFIETCRSNTSDEKTVKNRINTAVNAFDEVD